MPKGFSAPFPSLPNLKAPEAAKKEEIMMPIYVSVWTEPWWVFLTRWKRAMLIGLGRVSTTRHHGLETNHDFSVHGLGCVRAC